MVAGVGRDTTPQVESTFEVDQVTGGGGRALVADSEEEGDPESVIRDEEEEDGTWRDHYFFATRARMLFPRSSLVRGQAISQWRVRRKAVH